MKTKLLCLLLTVSCFASLTACRSGTTSAPEADINTSAPIEEPAIDTTVEADQEADPCAKGHTWVDATCTEPKTCSVCGKTEGESLGHEWFENTPNYQQAKTCARCGETEGEPLEAKRAGLTFTKVGITSDFPMTDGYDTSKEHIGKVWFDNYKTFESDDTHKAKEGYEYKSVDLHAADGEYSDDVYSVGDTWSSSFQPDWFGEYYQDKDAEHVEDGDYYLQEVNYNGKDYTCEIYMNEVSYENHVKNEEYAKKFGWTGNDTATLVYNYTVLVPKGFDGLYCMIVDTNEPIEDENDFYSRKNVVYFRFD